MKSLFAYHYQPRIVGIDLSDHVVRAVELQSHRGGHVLHALGEAGVPDGWLVDGEVHEPSKLADVIRTMLSHPLQGKFTSRNAVASLPEQRTFMKLVSLARFNPSEQAEAIRWEASQHLPFTLDEVELDAEFHPELDQNNGTAVVIAAAPKTIVESYITTLTAAGLRLVGLDLESAALTRSIIHDDAQATELLIDLGGNRTTVCVLGKGVVHFSSSLPFSGSDLTRTVSQRLHLTLSEAEKAKRIFGLSPSRGRGRVRAALLPELHALGEKIREIITFTQNHFPELAPPQRLLLTGGGSLLSGIDELFQEMLNVPTLEPSLVVKAQQKNAELPLGIRARFSTAIGLALSSEGARL
jgi:type IV pilus assembly protein PilM